MKRELALVYECGLVKCSFDCSPDLENLLVEVSEDNETIFVSPIGSYWVNNPEKLADILAVTAKKAVEVVPRDQLPE